MTIELAPSILSANFARLADDAKAALEGGGTVLHLDVMDGHFVPNITIGPPVVASLRKALPDAVFDCHLMIENPDGYIPAFADAGANWISVHHVLVMSVNPGFGSQTFIHGSLNKIKTLAEVRESLGLSFRIEVDGGVALDTVSDIVHAGAELLVAGNAVFGRGDIRENAKRLLGAARAAMLTRA